MSIRQRYMRLCLDFLHLTEICQIYLDFFRTLSTSTHFSRQLLDSGTCFVDNMPP